MWGIVEKVIDNKIYVMFEDRSIKQYINDKHLDIKESNQVLIINGMIVEVKEYNDELYKEIKLLQETIKKNN
jgi:hypothetical protein